MSWEVAGHHRGRGVGASAGAGAGADEGPPGARGSWPCVAEARGSGRAPRQAPGAGAWVRTAMTTT